MKEYEKLIDRFYEENLDKKISFIMIAGSHFFNLNSERSDVDYKGIYLPIDGKETKRGEVTYKTNTQKNKKNTSDDVDCTFFSLKKFLTLLASGDFNMIEMLFAPRDKIIMTSEIYEDLRFIRNSLLPNDISSFLGFIKREYLRYGIDKKHYGLQVRFLNFLKMLKKNSLHDRLKDHWLEIVNYVQQEESYIQIGATWNDNKEIPAVIITKRVFQYTVKIDYIVEAIECNLARYGHRQVIMTEEGLEFKGLYHAMRLIFEAEDLLTTGQLSFSFSADRHVFLRDIKNGKINQDVLFNSIDSGIERLYALDKKTISNKINIKYLVDKLIWKYYGTLEIKNLISMATKKNNI